MFEKNIQNNFRFDGEEGSLHEQDEHCSGDIC